MLMWNEKKWLQQVKKEASRSILLLWFFLHTNQLIRDIKMPQGVEEGGDGQACRLHGAFPVKKVAGNFHITTGRSIPHPQGHAHLTMNVPHGAVNYSHRIDQLAFGPPIPGVLNPLDAAHKLVEDRNHQFQYYLQVRAHTVDPLNK